MTADELDRLIELEAAATKGPWFPGCVPIYHATGYEAPEDMTAHIGGLIWQKVVAFLEGVK